MADDRMQDPYIQELVGEFQNKNKPISEKIRERLKKAGERFYAADNIADFIETGEREQLIEELTPKFEAVLDSLVIDRENDPNSKGTGQRLINQ